MGIDVVPVPPLRDLTNPRQVGRLMDYLHANSVAMQRLSDDTSVPTAPTLLTVRQGTGKVIEVDVTFTEPEGWTKTELYRNTVNDSASSVLIASGRSTRLTDTNFSFGTAYYYWAKVAVSASTSAFSPVGLITPVQVPTDDLADLAVTTGKRQGVNTQSDTQTVNAGSANTYTFSVATGGVNVVAPPKLSWTGALNDDITWRLSTNTTATIAFVVRNGTGSNLSITAEIYYW